MRVWTQILLPGNNAPRSRHRVKTLLKVVKNEEHYWHACSNCKCSWKADTKLTDEERAGDCDCGGTRYNKTTDIRGKLKFEPHWVGVHATMTLGVTCRYGFQGMSSRACWPCPSCGSTCPTGVTLFVSLSVTCYSYVVRMPALRVSIKCCSCFVLRLFLRHVAEHDEC